jgi:hypothetical protein
MSYEQCLADAMRMYRVDSPTDRCTKLANATWKMKQKYAQLRTEKQNRTIQLISKAPEVVSEKRRAVHTCQAVTLSGKSCGFKAVCGGFCRKHQPKIKY